MKTGLQKWHYISLIWGLCCVALVAVAAKPEVINQITDIGIDVQRIYGHGQPSQSLMISGYGNAIFKEGKSEHNFTVTGQELIDRVNDLHRLRFLDLPEKIASPQLLFLRADGSVGSQVFTMNDEAKTTICLSIGSTKKCSAYSESNGPNELKAWVQTLFANAVQRVEEK